MQRNWQKNSKIFANFNYEKHLSNTDTQGNLQQYIPPDLDKSNKNKNDWKIIWFNKSYPLVINSLSAKVAII